jgi:hypothetical protein
MSMENYDEDEEKAMLNAANGKRYEFTCIACDAHTPYGDGYTLGDEIMCCYCGVTFKVCESGGKWKLKEA